MEASKKYPSAEAERFQVRLPDGLRDEIRETAAANNRSMNAEIVARLSGQRQSLIDDIRQVVREEFNSRTFDPDGSYKPILPVWPYDGKPARAKP